MQRTQKQQLIDTLHADFERSPHAVLIDFRGLTVPAVTEFRRKVKQSGSRYRVVKNTLALRAAQGTALEKLASHFVDTTAVAYTAGDPVALAKVLVDFAKDNPNLRVKAAIVSGGQVLNADGVKALSSLPGLPELRAKLLGLLQAPASQLVRLLSTPATQLAQVLRAQQDKLGGGAAA
jgi:large subunit ribosomal protein L10